MCIIMSSCEDRFDSRGGNPSEEGKPVDVTLRIGLADEVDAYDLSTSTKGDASGDKAAFSFDLQPAGQTRAGETSLKPEALYNLEIQQYDAGGKRLGGISTVDETTPIGKAVTVTLQEALNCQLVLVAWGQGNTKRLGTKDLTAVQDTALDASVIKDLKPDVQSDMNKMPYVLHLKDVNVGENGHIYSKDGEAIDVRLRLQRLAARLTFSWEYNVNDYTPQQILIHSIPTNYKVVAAPDKTDKTYPSLLDRFTTISIPSGSVTSNNSYSCWIPANVRGSNPYATSLAYRIKSNAPTGSSYIRFIAVKNGTGNEKKKLDYRIYIGGKKTTDFNLYENTDYSYKATFSHDELPKNDLRVTIIDPTPASEGNENLVPTGNCFMVAPGGAFCFDPFVYQQNGQTIVNELLTEWAGSEGGIASVKLLWQTLENGDVGDPVMGVANSATDHSNIVDMQRIDASTGNATAKGQARIYCRVAPNTTGGSGAIAAYNAKGEVLWSWHIWVTNYNPDPTGDIDVQTPENKRKLKYTNGNAQQLPMMDRNLGAIAGYTTVPATELERSKANGFLYQWGRKDPFRSSYSSKKISGINVPAIDKPIDGLLSLYKEDGVTFYPMETTPNKTDYRTAYKYPQNIYKEKDAQVKAWINDHNTPGYSTSWGMDQDKGMHDPCPVGWRVCSHTDYEPLFADPASTSWSNVYFQNRGTISADGGALIRYDNDKQYDSYFRFTGYWGLSTQFTGIGSISYVWCREKVEHSYAKGGYYLLLQLSGSSGDAKITNIGWEQEALLTRCIQEQ